MMNDEEPDETGHYASVDSYLDRLRTEAAVEAQRIENGLCVLPDSSPVMKAFGKIDMMKVGMSSMNKLLVEKGLVTEQELLEAFIAEAKGFCTVKEAVGRG